MTKVVHPDGLPSLCQSCFYTEVKGETILDESTSSQSQLEYPPGSCELRLAQNSKFNRMRSNR
jgi:hypothetical protein